MKKILITAFFMLGCGAAIAQSDEPFYGVHTLDSFTAHAGKQCKMINQLGGEVAQQN